MRQRSLVVIVLAVVLAAGCTRGPAASEAAIADATSSPVTSTPSAITTPSPEPTATPLPSLNPEVEQAVTFRRTFGLRSDLPFVIASLTDPAATNLDYGVPVYPDEAIKLQADLADQNATIPIVVDYALGHADESGGVYIDRDQHVGMVTSLWTDHLPEHAAALAELLDGKVTLVRQVRYSEAELRTLQDRVFADRDWMEVIPAHMTGIGVGILENSVHMDVSSAEPTAVQQIVDHYDLGDKLVVTSDGTGVVFIASGSVKGKIRTADGRIPKNVDELNLGYEYDPAIPGYCGSGDVGYGIKSDGTFEYPCKAGVRTITVTGHKANGGNIELGRATVTVVADKIVRVTIRLKD